MELPVPGRALALEAAAYWLIASGVAHLAVPEAHARRWAIGPLRRFELWIAKRPGLSRATGVVRLAVGLWILLRLPVPKRVSLRGSR